MKHLPVTILLVSASVLIGCESSNTTAPPPGMASTGSGTPSDLMNFVGAGAGQAELGLNNLGYELVSTEGLTGFWWKEETQTCARIETADGRYQSIVTAPPTDCGKS